METIKIKTGGMHCPSCAMLIRLNVEELPGVEAVEVDHVEGMTTVSFDPALLDANTIAEEIRKSGYTAELPV